MTRALKIAGAMAIAIALCASFAGAQDKISPVSDYQFRKDYAQYENIRKETDLPKRAALLIAFMKEHPISKALSYVASAYQECVAPHLQNKDWAKVTSMEEELLKLMPTEKTVQAAAVPEPGASDFLKNILPSSLKSIQTVLLQVYYQANNLPKAAEMGETIYAAGPDKAMAAQLADIYLKMQNYDKYLIYGDKVLAEFPITQAYGMALQMMRVCYQR
jgi:hypothetical protein